MQFSDCTKMLEEILLPYSKKFSMIALPDRSYIIQQGDEVEIFVVSYLLQDGQVTQICENNKNTDLLKDYSLIL